MPADRHATESNTHPQLQSMTCAALNLTMSATTAAKTESLSTRLTEVAPQATHVFHRTSSDRDHSQKSNSMSTNGHVRP